MTLAYDPFPPEAVAPSEAEGGDALALFFHGVGVGVFQTTLDGRFVRANEAYARLLGYDTPAALIAEVHDIGRELYVDPTARAIQLAELLRVGRSDSVLHRMRRRDGTWFWAGASLRLVADMAGRPAWIVGTVSDVTEFVTARDARATAERDYRSIVENATVGVYRTTPDGRQLRANPALVRLNGFSTEQEMLAAVNDIAREWYVDPQRRDEFKRLMARDGRVENFESEIYRYKSRERIWVREMAWTIPGSDGTPLFYEGLVEEITAHKLTQRAMLQARIEVERAHAAKFDFLANVSHELRTPLNAIMGFTELMLRETFGGIGNPRYADYVRMIHQSAGHLFGLIEDILDISKHEAGKVDLIEEEIDPALLAAAALPMVEGRAHAGGIVLEVEIAPGTWSLRGDRKRLLQVLLNLLSNAIKFTPPAGTVTVRAAPGADGGLLLEVADTGIGIARRDLERVFEPFVQLHPKGIAASDEGTGLGLPLARRLAELHGGSVRLESAPGTGTTARLSLPSWRVLARA